MTNKLKLNGDLNIFLKPKQLLIQLIHNINKQYKYTKIAMPMFPQDTKFEESFMSNGASYNYIGLTEQITMGFTSWKKHSLFKPDRTLQDQKEHSVPLSEEQGRARSPWSQ